MIETAANRPASAVTQRPPDVRTPPSGDPVARVLEMALLLAVLFGAGLRIVQYLYRRSLWIDEAFLALNILSRDLRELRPPLDWLQVAPTGFLWIERVVTSLAGPSEWALRIVPLLLGIAVLWLMIPVARRLIHPSAALPVVASLACMPILVRYSNEAKPYIFDVFSAVLLCVLTLRALEREGTAVRLAWALLLLPFLSLPTAFVGAGVVTALLLREGTLRIDRSSLLAGGAWMAGTGASVLLSSDAATKTEMLRYWQGTFLIDPGAQWSYAQEVLRGFSRVTLIPLPGGDLVQIGAFVLLLLLGVVQVKRTAGERGVALVVVPLLTATAATMARQYPFAGRTWLWTLPTFSLLAVAGVYLLLTHRPAILKPAVAVLLSLVVLGTRGREAFYLARHPELGEHSRPVIDDLKAQIEREDITYVFARSAPAWLLYTTDWSAPPADLAELFELGRPGGPIYVNAWGMGPVTEPQLALLTRHDSAGRTVLMGRSSGFRINHTVPPDRGHLLDPAWASSEVTRIRAHARTGCAWIFSAHVLGTERDAFSREIARQNGKRSRWIEGSGADAERVCFPLATADSPATTP
ncbi:MAG: glycosyltransferase family 39 protein [Gemmatimonadota bacterium]